MIFPMKQSATACLGVGTLLGAVRKGPLRASLPARPGAPIQQRHCQREQAFGGRQAGLRVVSAATLEAASTVTRKAWPSRGGHQVKVQQTLEGDAYKVAIELVGGGGGLPGSDLVELHWGVFRADITKWQHPESATPPGSHLDRRSGGMRSPMQPLGAGARAITLSIPRALAPLTLAFAVFVPGAGGSSGQQGEERGRYITPMAGPHFTVHLGMEPGLPEPLGVSRLGDAPPGAGGEALLNFAVRTRGADKVSLVLLKRPAGAGAQGAQGAEGAGGYGTLEIALDPYTNRTGDTWHVALGALRGLEGLVYGWRVDGDTAWETGNRFQPNHAMLDPHAHHLAFLPLQPPPPLPLPTVGLLDGRRVAVAGSLVAMSQQHQQRQREQQQEAGGGAVPGELPVTGGLALEQLRLFELDVKTFTTSAKVQHPGQYLGVLEWVGHLRAVGANAVLLAPVYATGPGIGLLGRAAVSFMAPDPQLSSNPDDPTVAEQEFKTMVAGLHRQGIEVYMQMDFTFTAEGTDGEPNAISFRGLDNALYYRPNANGVLNCGNVVVREFIADALRYWAVEYGVDGFCFLNAENLVQDRDGLVLDAPPLLDTLALDPLLSSLKLIASPSDETLLPRGGARGFPHWGLWLQRNNLFTRDMTAFLLEGTSGMASAIATRLTGSPDIFTAQWDSGMPGDLAVGRRPAFGINAVSSLGHKSLESLAAEGAAMAAVPGLSAMTVAKTLLVGAILGQGLPMVSQDVTSGVELARFAGLLMRMRRRLRDLLLPPLFDSPRDIRWHGAAAGSEPDWDGSAALAGTPAANYIAFSVRGVGGTGVYLGINPHATPVQAALPAPPLGSVWTRWVDTGLEAPDDATLDGGAPLPSAAAPTTRSPLTAPTVASYRVAPKAAVLLVAAPGQQQPPQRPPPPPAAKAA